MRDKNDIRISELLSSAIGHLSVQKRDIDRDKIGVLKRVKIALDELKIVEGLLNG